MISYYISLFFISNSMCVYNFPLLLPNYRWNIFMSVDHRAFVWMMKPTKNFKIIAVKEE